MNGNVSKAMVLAAGEGTRLRPLTLSTPKPLVPVAGVPLIVYTLGWLRHHGIEDVAINLHHLGDKVSEALGDGSRLGLRIRYSPEDTLLGTAGGVKRVQEFFDDAFVVVYGDDLTDFNLSDMIAFHNRKQSAATMALMEVPDPTQVGIVNLAKDGRVVSFVEKPPSGTQTDKLANAGIYILETSVLNFISDQGPCDFGRDVFPALIRAGLPVYGYPLQRGEYILDIGSTDKYARANDDVRAGRVKTYLTDN